MKTRKILAASTAALLAFGTAAIVASASTTGSDATANTNSGSSEVPPVTSSEPTSSTPVTPAAKPVNLVKVKEDDATSIGAGVKITLSEAALEEFEKEKYEKYNIVATNDYVDGVKDGNKTYVDTGDDGNSTVKGLDKALKKEIAKIETRNFKIINIDLADGDYVESTSPVAIKITVTLDKNYNVYHVSGKTVEKLNKSYRKMTDGSYEISFTTKKFSPFIFTTADLKNAGSTTSDGEPTSAAASNGSSTNPNTGIALAIAPVVIAAGAVAVVALKKKK